MKTVLVITVLLLIGFYIGLYMKIGKQKAWIHLRFFLKFVPIQLFGVFISIYGAGFALLFAFIFGFTNFLIVWMLISVFFLPIALALEDLGKYNPLRFMLDDQRFDYSVNTSGVGNVWQLAEDYRNWLDGRMISFKTDWLWHTRNRIYNLQNAITPSKGGQYLVQMLQNELTFRDHTVKISDDQGFLKYDWFAGLKWITRLGSEGFQTHSGVKISYDYSVFGTMELYYRVGMDLYYKYSKCVLWFRTWNWIPIIGGKDIWYTIKYHPNNKIGTIHLKLQWEK